MSGKVVSTLALDGVEKFLCAHGSWMTVAHAAHLTGNRSTLIINAPRVIECLLKRYSCMRTRLRVDANQYLIDFFEYDSEYLSSHLFFSTVNTTDSSWQQIVENQCNQDPYSDNGTIIFPMFHFMLLFDSQQMNDDCFHLILFANHCVSDGRSGFILLNDFLTMATDSSLQVRVEPLNNEILPLINELIPRPTGLLYPFMSFIVKRLLKRQLRQLRRISLRIPIQPILHRQCKPSKFDVQRYKNKFLFSSSSQSLYANLHKQCRSQQVTLNGPLFGCLLLALHHCFPLNNHDRLEPFEIGVAFDMRSRLPQSPLTSSSVGYFVFGSGVRLTQSLPTESTRFWSLAHQCMINTVKQVRPKSVSFIINILNDIFERNFDKYTQFFPEGRQTEVGFSNVGKYPFPCEYDQGNIQLRGLHVINNASVYRVSTTLFVTCANNEQLDFSLAHEIESDEKAKEFLDYYVRLLEACADKECCHTETTLDQLFQSVESRSTLYGDVASLQRYAV